MINRNKLFESLKELADSRPGFELTNYDSTASYKSDYRSYKKYADINRVELKWSTPESLFDLLTDENILSAFSDRLNIIDAENGTIEYITGQYYPVEYQYAIWLTLRQLACLRRVKFEAANKKEA